MFPHLQDGIHEADLHLLRVKGMVGGAGLELEPLCGRERDGSPQSLPWAQSKGEIASVARDLTNVEDGMEPGGRCRTRTCGLLLVREAL